LDVQNISALGNYFLHDDCCCNRIQTIFSYVPGELFALFASLVVTGLASALKIFNFPGKALYYGKMGDALK